MIPPVPVPLRFVFVSALRGASAFGLVETLVAAALLSVTLAAALNAFVIGARALAFGERDTVAVFLADDKLERIRAWARGTGAGQGFLSLGEGGTCHVASDGPCRTEEPGALAGHPDVRRIATITAVTPALQLVEVEVTYTAAAASRRLRLATLVAQRP